MDLIIPLFLAYIIDEVIPLEDIKLLLLFGFLMIVCTIIALLGNVIANRMASFSSMEITKSIRLQLFRKIIYLSKNQVDEISVPSLVARMTTDTYNIHQMLGRVQRGGIRAPILLVGGIIVTLIINYKLTLILLVTLPLICLITYFASKKGFPLYQDVQKNNDRIVEVVRDNVTGIRVIKALSKTEYEKKRFDSANQNMIKSEKKASFMMAKVNPVVTIILNIGLSFVILFGAYLVKNNQLGPGKIISFTLIFNNILNATIRITRIFITISKSTASIKRIQTILDLKTDLEIISGDSDKKEMGIIFNHVSFTYKGTNNFVSDLYFKVKKGESLGIIGTTGSGKSTIINLLMRFYDPDEGEIYLDGKNIKGIPQEKLHSMFGTVFQNDILFGDTVYHNIDFYRNLGKDQIVSAIHDAGADFVYELEGLDAIIAARGINLSGGQKKRILIARALASKPEILIFDDASSALDYQTDANIRKVIREKYQDTTMVIVAERISSVKHCSKIIILEEGRIVGCGTHQELLGSSSIYQQISSLQMGDCHE